VDFFDATPIPIFDTCRIAGLVIFAFPVVARTHMYCKDGALEELVGGEGHSGAGFFYFN
jgi:hypothetical protein